jgi:VCBS repeat-containing protein
MCADIAMIARVTGITGTVEIVPPTGQASPASFGSVIGSGDAITSTEGALSFVTLDGVVVSVGSDTTVVLHGLKADPENGRQTILLKLIAGDTVIVSTGGDGQSDLTVTVDTGIAAVQISDAQAALSLQEGKGLSVILMRDADGKSGEITVVNDRGVEVLDEVHEFTFVVNADSAPTASETMDEADVIIAYAEPLSNLPGEHGKENDYGLEADRSGGDASEPDIGTLANFDTEVGENIVLPDFIPVAGEPVRQGSPFAPEELYTFDLDSLVKDSRVQATVERRDTILEIEPDALGIVVNEAPIAFAKTVEAREDELFGGQLIATDPDQDSIMFRLTDGGGPEHGTVVLNSDGGFSYVPDANYSGPDGFNFVVEDDRGGTNSASVTLNILPVNDAPIPGTPAFEMNEDGTLTLSAAQLLANAIDADGDPLTVSGLSVDLGTLSDNGDNTWTFAPPADWNGDLNLSYAIGDGTSNVATTASVSIANVNDAPIPGTPAFEMNEDGTLTLRAAQLLADAVDADGDPLTVSGLSVDLGTLSDNGDNTWTFAPPADWNGDLNLSYAIGDGTTNVATTATVRVSAVADVPILEANDTIVEAGGLPGDDKLKGTSEDDILVGGGGDDNLQGKSGDDILYGDGRTGGAVSVPLSLHAAAADTDGSETVLVAISNIPADAALSAGTDNGDGTWTLTPTDLDGLTLNLADGFSGDLQLAVSVTSTDTGPEGETHTALAETVLNIRYADGEAGDDYLAGGSGGDTLYGDTGDDKLRGDSGKDLLYGGDGDDELLGGSHDDVLHGGAGDDEIHGGSHDDVLYGEAGDDEMRGDSGDDIIYGGAGDDTIRGDSGDDTIVGGAGSDMVEGGSGKDTIFGSDGDDRLIGGASKDLLEGGAGDDVLVGGKGDDKLIGGAGIDTFIFSTKDGKDTVADIEFGDQIRFEGGKFDADKVNFTQNGDDTVITFDGVKNFELTLEDLTLDQQSYTITQEPDSVVISLGEPDV